MLIRSPRSIFLVMLVYLFTLSRIIRTRNIASQLEKSLSELETKIIFAKKIFASSNFSSGHFDTGHIDTCVSNSVYFYMGLFDPEHLYFSIFEVGLLGIGSCEHRIV